MGQISKQKSISQICHFLYKGKIFGSPILHPEKTPQKRNENNLNNEKFYTWHEFFTQTLSMASVTNMTHIMMSAESMLMLSLLNRLYAKLHIPEYI